MKLIDLTGKKFNKLTVKHRAKGDRNGSSRWLCVCECGNEKVFSSDHLTRKTRPVKSCGCNKHRRGKNNPLWTGVGDISGNWWSCHVKREKTQIARRKVELTVTIEEAWDLFLKQNRKCALSGITLQFASENHYNTASLDRIDSNVGYHINNVQWVHKDVNFMKRTYSQQYFIDLCKKIADNNVIGVCEIE